jgi:hypothetical protein
MRFVYLRNLSEVEFRRLTAVMRGTFEAILLLLIEAEKEKKLRGGKLNKLLMEEVLVKYKSFALPRKKALLASENHYEVVVIDASESSQKKQKLFYSGKKKRHTLKHQLVVDY